MNLRHSSSHEDGEALCNSLAGSIITLPNSARKSDIDFLALFSYILKYTLLVPM